MGRQPEPLVGGGPAGLVLVDVGQRADDSRVVGQLAAGLASISQ